jgi:hypothetical protein
LPREWHYVAHERFLSERLVCLGRFRRLAQVSRRLPTRHRALHIGPRRLASSRQPSPGLPRTNPQRSAIGRG